MNDSLSPNIEKPLGGLPTTGMQLDDASMAKALKALGHPARLALLRSLAAESCCCGDLVSSLSNHGLSLAQSTVSQHLNTLVDAQLIVRHTSGVESIYTLNQDVLRALGDNVGSFAHTCCANTSDCRPTDKKGRPA